MAHGPLLFLCRRESFVDTKEYLRGDLEVGPVVVTLQGAAEEVLGGETL